MLSKPRIIVPQLRLCRAGEDALTSVSFGGALSTFTATKVQTTVVHKGLTPNVLELILLAFSFFFSFFLMSRAVECDLQYLRCVLVFVGVLFDYL